MTFPITPLPVMVELLIDNVWTDITAFTRGSPEFIDIGRGRSNEAAQVEASRCSLTVNNRDGRFSPRNPLSPLYGLIGRNTPLRVRIGAADPSPLVLPGLQTAYVFSPTDPAFDIAGDLDVRIDVEPDDWAGSSDPLVPFALANRAAFTWRFDIFNDGVLQFQWADDATGDPQTIVSTVEISQVEPRRALRVTMDVDNGAAGHTVTFYTADTIAGPWTQLGTPVTQAFVTAFNVPSDNQLEIGRDNGGLSDQAEPFAGTLHGFQLRDGIDGTVVANPDFTALDPDPSFTDIAGRTWTIVGAAVTDPSLRFAGEVPAWPQRWDRSGQDVWVPIDAAGVLRRLGQGASPIGSALKRSLKFGNGTPLVAYWPCEDFSGSTNIASALPGADPIVPNPLPDFAASDLFAASEPLTVMTQDNDSEWRVSVPNYIPSIAAGEGQCSFLFHIDGTPSATQGVVALLTEGSAVGALHLRLTSGGFLQLDLFDEDGVLVDSSAQTAETVTNRFLYLNLSYQVGVTNITYALRSLEIGQGESSGAILLTATHPTGAGMGKIKGLVVNSAGDLTANGARLTIGHITVQGDQDLTGFRERAEVFNAYVGENALARIQRLSAEEDEPFTFTDDPALTAAMGAQLPKTFVELIREAAIADQGILYEPRGARGLAYRSRVGLYNQAATLALDYTAGVFSSIPEPIDDDQLTRNDITVTRQGGSSHRAVLETGTLSVQSPPDGVGRYDTGVTVNLHGDGQLPNDASWRLSLGVDDEPRFPSLALHLHNPVFAGNAALTAAAKSLDLGDRITIANMPDWVSRDLVSQMAQGFTERLSNFLWFIEVNASPESPFQVAEYEAAAAGTYRYDTAGSSLAAQFISGTDTSMSVNVDILPLWTTVAGEMPFDIEVGGTRLTVTAITGASSPQTFTITQTPVNGIAKTIPAGTLVSLWTKAKYAL